MTPSDRIKRNPIEFLLLRAMYKWEVAKFYGTVSRLNMARYITLERPVKYNYKPEKISILKGEEILSIERYFLREVCEKVEDLEFSEESLDRLAQSISILGSFKNYLSYQLEIDQYESVSWANSLIIKYGGYSKVPKEDRNELNLKVNAILWEMRLAAFWSGREGGRSLNVMQPIGHLKILVRVDISDTELLNQFSSGVAGGEVSDNIKYILENDLGLVYALLNISYSLIEGFSLIKMSKECLLKVAGFGGSELDIRPDEVDSVRGITRKDKAIYISNYVFNEFHSAPVLLECLKWTTQSLRPFCDHIYFTIVTPLPEQLNVLKNYGFKYWRSYSNQKNIHLCTVEEFKLLTLTM